VDWFGRRRAERGTHTRQKQQAIRLCEVCHIRQRRLATRLPDPARISTEGLPACRMMETVRSNQAARQETGAEQRTIVGRDACRSGIASLVWTGRATARYPRQRGASRLQPLANNPGQTSAAFGWNRGQHAKSFREFRMICGSQLLVSSSWPALPSFVYAPPLLNR